jgi:hypothetical protein
MYAIKTEIRELNASSWTFDNQKSMYGGKRISEGDQIFVFASENEGGPGLIACGIVTAARPTPTVPGVQRQTPRISITVGRTGNAAQSLGRAELTRFRDWDDGRPETELNFKLYRQATNKIVGLSEGAAVFLRACFPSE